MTSRRFTAGLLCLGLLAGTGCESTAMQDEDLHFDNTAESAAESTENSIAEQSTAAETAETETATDAEVREMLDVDAAINKALFKNPKYDSMSQKERANTALKTLRELESQGKVKKGTIAYAEGGDNISFQYANGALGGVSFRQWNTSSGMATNGLSAAPPEEGITGAAPGLDVDSEEALIDFIDTWDSTFTEQAVKDGFSAEIEAADADAAGKGTIKVKDKAFEFSIDSTDMKTKEQSSTKLSVVADVLYMSMKTPETPEPVKFRITGMTEETTEATTASYDSDSTKLNEFIDSVESAELTIDNAEQNDKTYTFILKNPADDGIIITDTDETDETDVKLTPPVPADTAGDVPADPDTFSVSKLVVKTKEGRISALDYTVSLKDQVQESKKLVFNLDQHNISISKPADAESYKDLAAMFEGLAESAEQDIKDDSR